MTDYVSVNFVEMGFIRVCLLNSSQMSLVLIDRNCGYMKLVDTAVTEFGLDPAKVAVTMKYILNNDLPPIICHFTGGHIIFY